MIPPRLQCRSAASRATALLDLVAVVALGVPALQPEPVLAVPRLDSGLAAPQERMRGLLNSIEIRLQRRPPQMEDLEARERQRPLRRSDRVGKASYGAVLDGASRLQGQARLHFVNSVWNNLRYVADRELYGMEDYWATPAETARQGAGDCEDLAIAKYYTLRDLGHATGSLRLMLVALRRSGEPHMLVCVRGKDGVHCLDNRRRRLLSDREASLAYRPIVSASERLAVLHLSPRPTGRLATNARARAPLAAQRAQAGLVQQSANAPRF